MSKKQPFKKQFLDYEIINTWNSDGYVLKSPEVRGFKDPHFYECHLGNYSTLEKAMESAITYFMIKRIDIFHASIHHRTLGTKTASEFSTFANVLMEENIPMPKEIEPYSDGYVVQLRGK